jgi:uncharacterized protein (TIGR02453 family)
MRSPFTRDTLAFLRALKRHNDREWFRAHRNRYEAHVRGPMTMVIRQLAVDFSRIAPDLVADPKVSLIRVYRDTRFSADKTPLKTNVAARFPARGFARGEGAGLYFEVAPDGVWMGGGFYTPPPAALQAIRADIAEDPARLRRIVGSRRFRDAVGVLSGDQLTRVPRGFTADHPAAPYLRFKQFVAGREFEAAFATSPRFYPTLLTVFQAVYPLVALLNEPLRRRARWTLGGM